VIDVGRRGWVHICLSRGGQLTRTPPFQGEKGGPLHGGGKRRCPFPPREDPLPLGKHNRPLSPGQEIGEERQRKERSCSLSSPVVVVKGEGGPGSAGELSNVPYRAKTRGGGKGQLADRG